MADDNAQDTGQVAQPPPVTDLSDTQEKLYRQWMNDNHLTGKDGYNVDSGYTGRDYDMRGYWLESGGAPHKAGDHFPDTYKLPNHETFSDQSRYAVGANAAKAGHWDGNTFVPPMDEVTVSAGRKQFEKPTQEAIDYLNAHPESWQQYEEIFGSVPKGWSKDKPAKPLPTPEALDYLQKNPQTASQFKEIFGELPDGFKQPGPESSWGDVAQAASTNIGAHIERGAAAVQESGGAGSFVSGAVTGALKRATGSTVQDISSPYAQAKLQRLQALAIPDALQYAQEHGTALTDDPLIQLYAERAGVRPDQFTKNWKDYANKSPEELKKFIEAKTDEMSKAQGSMQEGTKRRELAKSVEEQYAPNVQPGSLKSVAFEGATQLPQIAGAVAVGMIPVIGPIAGTALLGSDMGLQAYSHGKDAGLADDQAKAYGLLTAATAAVPGVTVGQALSKAPGMGLVLKTAFGQALGKSAVTKLAGGGIDQTLSLTVMNALQQGIDKGFISPDMTLKEAMHNIADSMLSSAAIGFGITGFHQATHAASEPGLRSIIKSGTYRGQKIDPTTLMALEVGLNKGTLTNRMGLEAAMDKLTPKTPADLQDEQAHGELLQGEQEQKDKAAADAEKKAASSAKDEEKAEPRSPVMDANVAALQKKSAGQELSPQERDMLIKSGLMTVGKRTGAEQISPAGKRLMAEQAAKPKEDTYAPPAQDTGVSPAPGGEARDEEAAGKAPRTPSETEDQAGAEARRSAAFDQADAGAATARAGEEDAAYAQRAKQKGEQEQRARDEDYPKAKNQAADEGIETSKYAESGLKVSMAEAIAASNKRPEEVAATIPRAEGLTAEQREVESKFVDKLAGNVDAAIEQYSKLPQTMGGKIVGTDEAREVSDDYAAGRKDLSQAVHEPASWLTDVMYKRLIAQPPKPGEDPLAIIMAGGSGSGKSSAIDNAGPLTKRAQVIYDTTLGNPDSAIDKVDSALKAGKFVSVPFIYHDPVESWKNTLLRAGLNNRTVPSYVHKSTHEGAVDAIKALRKRFGNDERVQFFAIDNSLGDANSKVIDLDEALKKPSKISMTEMRDIAREFLADGKITPEVYELAIGEPAERAERAADSGKSQAAGGADGKRDEKRAQPEHQGVPGRDDEARSRVPVVDPAVQAKLDRAEAYARRQLGKERQVRDAALNINPTEEIAQTRATAVAALGRAPASTSHRLLEGLIAAGEKGQLHPVVAELAKSLRAIMPDIPIRMMDTLINPTSGKVYGQNAAGLMHISPDGKMTIQIRKGMSAAMTVQTALHEMVHGATKWELDRNPNGVFAKKLENLLAEARAAASQMYGDDVVAAHVEWAAGTGFKPDKVYGELYGLSNVHEMLAEAFTNPDFQALLATVDPSRPNFEKKEPLLWRKFVNAVRDLLGASKVGVNNSLLEDIISTGAQVMIDQSRRLQTATGADIGAPYRGGVALSIREDKRDLGADIAEDIERNRMTRFVKQASQLGALKMARGIVRFEDWADTMRQELGKGIEPALRQLYQLAKDKVVDVQQAVKTRKSGEIVGAPKGTMDTGLVRDRLRQLAREGEYGRFWYERSWKAMVDSVGGDKKEAKIMVGIMSIFSAGASVDANTTMGMRAYYQYKAGEAISVGTSDQNEIAQKWVDSGGKVEPTGMKRSNFYGNLLDIADGETGHVFGDGATVDRWMMRVAGFHREAPTDAQYAFVTDQVRAISDELGWKTKQGQAAVWTAIKARWEKIADAGRAEALEKGWIAYPKNMKKGGRNNIKVLDPEKYYGMMLDRALATTISEGEIKQAARDFQDTFNQRKAQVSWEAMPGVASGKLGGADKLPLHALAAFQADVSAAHANPLTGNDQLREALGLMSAGSILGNSAWFRDHGQVMRFRHWGPPGIDVLDPARQGTGAAGQISERNRETKVTSLYPFDYASGQPEEQVKAGRTEYVVEVPAQQLYDADRDPRGLKQAAMEPTSFDFEGKPYQFTYNHDAFEKLLKDSGYAGYYVSREADGILAGQARLFQKWPAVESTRYRGNESIELYSKAGAQEEIYAPPAKKAAEEKGATIDPQARDAIQVYAASLGLLNNQDSVGWHIPRWGVSQKAGNGIDVRMDVQPHDFEEAYKAVYDAARAAGLDEQTAASLAPIQTRDGFRFINWGAMDNKKFQDMVRSALVGREGDMFPGLLTDRKPTIQHFAAEGGLINASDYERIISGSRHGPAAQRAIADIQRRLTPVYEQFAQRHGLTDAARPPPKTDGPTAKVSAPVSVDQLINGGAHEAILSKFGTVGGEPLDVGMKHYPIVPEQHGGAALDEFIKQFGRKLQNFSFVEDASKGIEFRIPQLGKKGYDAGNLWIYDPRIESGSFHDAEYTRVWRATHELGHDITEQFMQSRYGDSRRYGAMGRETMQPRGKLGKQVDVPVPGLTLAEAQRAVEWEDVAMRAQRMLLDKMGIKIPDEQFNHEWNLNMADAMYRVLTGDFSDPFTTGFRPSSQMTNMRDVLVSLEATEKKLAYSQGRLPKTGYDLSRWSPVSDNEIRQAIEARQNADQKTTKFSVRSEDHDFQVRVVDTKGNDIPGEHENMLFGSREEATDYLQQAAQRRAGAIKGSVDHDEGWSTSKDKSGTIDRIHSIEPVAKNPLQSLSAPSTRGDPADNFLKEWGDKFPRAGGMGDRMVNGNVMMGMVKDVTDTGGTTMYLTSVLSLEPGKGAASRAMIDAMQMADRHGVAVELNASAFNQEDARSLRQDQLVAWYKRNGFKDVSEDGNASLMRREPQKDAQIVPFATNAGKGISAKDAAEVIKHAQSMFPNAQHHLVESIEDAPHEVQAQAAAQGVTDRVVAAIHHDYDGTHVYVVRNNTESVEHTLHTIMQEHVGHAGIAGTFGEGVQNVMDGFIRNPVLRPKIERARRQWGLSNDQEGMRAAAEEWIAHTANLYPKALGVGSPLAKLYREAKLWLASKGVPITLNEADARQALIKAHDYVTSGNWTDNIVRAREAAEVAKAGVLEGTYIPGSKSSEYGANIADNLREGYGRVADSIESSMGSTAFNRFRELIEMREHAKDLEAKYGNATRGTGTMTQAQLDEYRAHPKPSQVQDMINREFDDEGKPRPQQGRLTQFAIKTGDPDLDELLNDKIGGKPQGWRSRLASTLRDGRAKSVVSLLDAFHRIKQYEQDGQVPPAESGYLSLRTSTNVAPLLRTVWEWGGLKWTSTSGFDPDKSMASDFDKTVKPLNTILAPLHNDPVMLRKFEGYLVALRAKELMAQGRENLIEQKHITAGLKLGQQYPHFEVMRRDYMKLNKNILDFAEKAGVLDPETRKLWESEVYVPFYRVLESGDGGPWSAGQLNKIRNPIVELRGGKSNINDVTGNIVRNWATLINAAIKAHAVRTAVDNLAAAGVAVRVPSLERGRDALVSTSEVNRLLKDNGLTDRMSPSSMGAIQKLMSLSAPAGDDIVQVWRGGKREYYRLDDPLLARAFGSLRNSPLRALRESGTGRFLTGLATVPKFVATKLITENPAFGIRTLWKDNINAWTVGRGVMPVTPVVSAITGLVKAMSGSEDFRRMSAAGATFNAGRADPYDTAISVKRYMEKPGTKWIPGSGYVARAWDFYRDAMLSGENASRVTMYGRTLKETGSHKLAAFEARDLMDYAMRGTNPIMQFVIETVPFFGAHTQGLYKTARATAGDDVIGTTAKAIATRVIKYGLLSMAASALYAMNRQRPEYDDLPPIQKQLYYHLYLPNGIHLKIPKAFESGTLFGTVPEAITEAVMSKFDPQTVKEQTMYLLSAFTEALNLNPIPFVARPPLELAINKDMSTGYPILSEHDQGLMPQEQVGPQTSPLVTGMARAMPEKAPDFLKSPKQFQHLLSGYFALMGSYALNGADYLYRQETGAAPAANRNLGQIPVVGSFVNRTEDPASSTRSLGTLSEVMIAANKLTKSVKDLETKGDDASVARAEQLTRENLPLTIASAAMKPASDAIKELQQAKRLVQSDPDLSPEAKRKQLNEIQDAINKTARDVYEYRPGGKMNREILQSITPDKTPTAKARVLRDNDMPALASIALQYGTSKMPASVQAAIEELG